MMKTEMMAESAVIWRGLSLNDVQMSGLSCEIIIVASVRWRICYYWLISWSASCKTHFVYFGEEDFLQWEWKKLLK